MAKKKQAQNYLILQCMDFFRHARSFPILFTSFGVISPGLNAWWT